MARTLEEGRANLAQAQRVRQQLVTELEALKGRLATARAREEVNELAAVLRDMPMGPDSELGRAVAQLKDRARGAERRADLLATEGKAGSIVDWTGTSPPADVTQAIDRFLNEENSKLP